MADLTPLLREIRGMYTDRPRDRLPDGMVWELVDYVPSVLQGGVRIRGAWKYQTSSNTPNTPNGMIYAPFRAGGRLLVANGSTLSIIPTPTPGAPSSAGTIVQTKQNPVFHRDRVIIPAADGTSAARYVTFNGTTYTIANAPATALTGKYAAVWKDRLLLGNSAASPTTVAFSKPGDPTAAWDSISLVSTAYDLTGLAVLGNSILCLHASSVERLRGSIPPDSTLTDPTGDLILDELSDRTGCYDARSIAYWNENALFCDSRGITLTDGATVRNVIQQSGNVNLWQDSWIRGGNPPTSVAGVVHRDYYIVTIQHTALPAITIIVDLPTRRVFKFSNISAVAYAFSSGVTETLYAAESSTWAMDLSPLFDPDPSVAQIDGNGVFVLPVIESGFSMLTKDVGFKRVVEVHVTYEATHNVEADMLRIGYVNSPTAAAQTLGELPRTTAYRRRSIPVGRRLPGFGVRIEQLDWSFDTRLYDVSLRAYAEEASRT